MGEFLRRHVRGIDDLEVLVRLSRQRRRWNLAELTQELGTTEMSVRSALEQLRAAGLVNSSSEEYWFEPVDTGREATVADVLDAYRTLRVRVISFVFNRPSPGIRAFADAFRLRRDEEDG